jgi:hypothetical protein
MKFRGRLTNREKASLYSETCSSVRESACEGVVSSSEQDNSRSAPQSGGSVPTQVRAQEAIEAYHGESVW